MMAGKEINQLTGFHGKIGYGVQMLAHHQHAWLLYPVMSNWTQEASSFSTARLLMFIGPLF